jgi:hypothetical protein
MLSLDWAYSFVMKIISAMPAITSRSLGGTYQKNKYKCIVKALSDCTPL